MDDARELPLEALDLSPRVYNMLKRLTDIMTIGDLLRFSEDELLAIPGFGRSLLRELTDRLALRGFELPPTGEALSPKLIHVSEQSDKRCNHEWHSAGYRPVDAALILYCLHCGKFREYPDDEEGE